MSDQLHSGKGFLKEKLGNYQVDPPESVWNSVSASLGSKNRRGLYLMILAGAASVALAVTLGITYFKVETPADLSDLEGQVVSREGNKALDESTSSIAQTRSTEKLEEKVAEAMVLIAREDEPGDEASFAHQGDEVYQVDEVNRQENTSLEDTKSLSDPPADTALLLTLDAGENLLVDQLGEFETANKRDPRWMLGAVVSPLYSYRDADMEAMSGGSEYESGLVSYAGGINVSYRGNSRLAIESGIHFNKMGISIGAPGIQLFNNSMLFAPMRDVANRPELIAITNSVGNIVTESGQVIVNGYKLNAEYGADAISNSEVADIAQVAEQGIEQHLDYLEVPFNVRYTLVDRTFELQLVGGMSTNFLVKNYVTMETASGTADIGYLTNVRSINYSGNAGIGMIYHFHERFSFLLEPRFRYFLNSVNDATLPSTRPYALGIYTGISYTF
jgi:hypothetical protein